MLLQAGIFLLGLAFGLAVAFSWRPRRDGVASGAAFQEGAAAPGVPRCVLCHGPLAPDLGSSDAVVEAIADLIDLHHGARGAGASALAPGHPAGTGAR